MLPAIVALLALLTVIQLAIWRWGAGDYRRSSRTENLELPITDPLVELLKHRYIVTLLNEEHFGGVLIETAAVTAHNGTTVLVYTFDQCSTVATNGGTPDTIAGRVIIESSAVAYLQQVS